MHATLYYSKPFRNLNIIDESNRDILAIEVDTSLPAERVIRILKQLSARSMLYASGSRS
jgi:putative transposase